jgi:hypothetical protein
VYNSVGSVPRRKLVEDGVPVTVYLPRSLVERLQREASERGYTLSQYLRLLLAKTENAQPQAEPERTQATQPSPSPETQPNQPEAVTVTVEDRLSQSAVSPAGTDVAPQARKRRWSFCPQCLNMYDREGKCPYCGVDLIPLDTDENKMLYLKLKQERGRG